MQGVPYLDVNKLTEAHMVRLGECAYRILSILKSTPEGRKMLREEIELMRKEQAERRMPNVRTCDHTRKDDV